MPVRFSRAMGMSEAEFLDQVPQGFYPLEPRRSGNRIEIADGNRRITITLTNGTYKQVQFEFDGYSEEEVRDVMIVYDDRTAHGSHP